MKNYTEMEMLNLKGKAQKELFKKSREIRKKNMATNYMLELRLN